MSIILPETLQDLSTLAGSLLAAFASPFTQASRIVRLSLSAGSGLAPDTLLAHRVIGHEAVSDTYRFTVEALSADSFIELKDLCGQGAAITVQTADGGERIVTGLVTRAQSGGSNGGMARYILQIEPALATLTERINSRTFQDKDVIEIVQTILQEHIAGNPVFTKHFTLESKAGKTYPKRSYCQQYRESDYSFVTRLLAEEGISFCWAYRDDDVPVHTMVLFDDAYQLGMAMQARVRFHRADGTENEDSITDWQGARQIGAGFTSLNSFDYKRAATSSGKEQSNINQGDNGNALSSTLEAYEHQAPYYGADDGELARYALLRQQAADLQAKSFNGSGTVRGLGAGEYFSLLEHPVHEQDYSEDREFAVLTLDWIAENNLPSEAASTLRSLFPQASLPQLAGAAGVPDSLSAMLDTGAEQRNAPYRCSFNAVRRGIPIVPGYSRTDHAKPTAPGIQTAMVVGPAGEEIFTDEHGRIKVQFHWQRRQDHPEGGADFDDKSSTWVRVSYASADANWGTQHIPRVGSEVLIGFIESDIDRPVCLGNIHNGLRMPPAFGGAGSLPANKALSGTKTKEYKGGRYNQLRFDDSTDQIGTQLMSEHGHTQLNQGWLGTPRRDGKSDPRGEGFELRSDAAGAIRAAKGLLLSAEPKDRAGGRQLDREALIRMLDAALQLAERLGDHAAAQRANQPETGRNDKQTDDDALPGKEIDSGCQSQLRQAIVNIERDSNTDPQAKNGSGKQRGGQSIVAVSGPDGVAIGSPKSITVAAGTNIDQVASRDTNQTSGRRWIHNAAESISLFVSGGKARIKETFKIIAAKGNLQMQAQDGEIEASAQKDFRITSVNGKVIVHAPSEILLTAGGGYIRIGANIEIHNPGKQSQKADSFALTGPTSLESPLPTLPNSVCKECLQAARAAGSPFALK